MCHFLRLQSTCNAIWNTPHPNLSLCSFPMSPAHSTTPSTTHHALTHTRIPNTSWYVHILEHSHVTLSLPESEQGDDEWAVNGLRVIEEINIRITQEWTKFLSVFSWSIGHKRMEREKRIKSLKLPKSYLSLIWGEESKEDWVGQGEYQTIQTVPLQSVIRLLVFPIFHQHFFSLRSIQHRTSELDLEKSQMWGT